VTLSDGHEVRGRSVILAGGVDYRRLAVPGVEELIGRGVYYGAAVSEAPAMAGRPVVVVGGGNSAGQAALHLAKVADRVTLLVRGPRLAASMSDYLVGQLGATRNVEVRHRCEVRAVTAADDRLESIVVEHLDDASTEELAAAGLFVLIGSVPRTEWLDGVVARDPGGFVLTGAAVDRSSLADPERAPVAFATSVPGVLAIGDTRHGSVKRVATAVGDGAGAVAQLHAYLAASAGVSG
jgi:thioredoxin reductase (NADPH)